MSLPLARLVSSALSTLEDCRHRSGSRSREPLVCARCVATAREVLRSAKKLADDAYPEPVRHGDTCPKAAHIGIGHLHAANADGPYDVDGLTYCGRCHRGLDR